MGSRRIAHVLARAGLHLGATTVRRMLRPARKPELGSTARERLRVVTAKRPNHVRLADLTTVPTSLGFWLPWSPQALPQRWPFCWWLAVMVDHYSAISAFQSIARYAGGYKMGSTADDFYMTEGRQLPPLPKYYSQRSK